MKFAVPAALAIALLFAVGTAAAKTLTPQQQKMGACSKQAHAKSLKGAEYKTYMSTCLKGGSAAAPAAPVATSKATTQQERMTTCNADAKTKALKGAARKSFMSSCLKGESPPAAAPAVTVKSASTGKVAQQEKMKTCNADATTKSLKGAARTTFMSTCLKGEAAAPASH